MLDVLRHFPALLLLLLIPVSAAAEPQPCGDGLVVKLGGEGCVGETGLPTIMYCAPEDKCITKRLWWCTVGEWEKTCRPRGTENYDFPVGGSCGGVCSDPCVPGEERPCTPSGATTSCGVEACDENNSWSGECGSTPECSDDGPGGDPTSGGGPGGPPPGAPPPPPPGEPCKGVNDPIDVTTGYFDWKSHHDDAPLTTELGGLQLGRLYASRRVAYDLMRVDSAMPGSPRAWDIAATPSNGLGIGWTHTYDHWLVIGTDVLHVRPTNESEYYTQDSVTLTKYRPERPDGTLVRYASGQWILEYPDQSRLVFEGSSLARLVTVFNAKQQQLDLKYYGASEPDSCSSSNPAIQGKLCTVKDPNGSTIRLIYDSTGALAETRYNGPGASAYGVTSYSYSGFAIDDLYGKPLSYSVSLLAAVSFSTFDGESYTYTGNSYARTDLTGYPASAPIVVRRRRVPMLSRERDAAGHFLSGHEFTTDGRAAAGIIPGELIRLEYEPLSSTEVRVIVTNESVGTSAEYVVINKEIEDVSNQCSSTCSVDPAHYTRDSNKKVTVREEAPADPLADPVRSTFARDSQSRVTLYQRNWSGAVGTVSSDPDSVSSPVHIERFHYLDADSGRVDEASPVYSVACTDAATFGLSCSGVSSGFEPKKKYDYDTDYDAVFNESAGSLATQVASTGLTITDIDTGEIGEVTRTTQHVFDSTGLLTATHVAAGTAEEVTTTYSYYGSSAGADAGRLESVTIGTTTIEERGGYDDYGRLGWTQDPRNGPRREFTYSASGKVTRNDLVAGAVTRYQERGYSRERHLAYTKHGATYAHQTDYSLFNGEGATVPPSNAAFCALNSVAAVADCLYSLGKINQPNWSQHTYRGTLYNIDRYNYDTAGNRVDFSQSDIGDVMRHRWSYAFDDRGRLEREFKYTDTGTGPAYVRETYRDAQGRTTSTTEPRFASVSASHAANEANANRSFAYDALDRLVAVTEGAQSMAPRTTSFTYDAHDNLSSMTDPDGRVTRYLYDDFGSLIAVKSPDSGTTLYRYDAMGRQVEAKYADGRHTAIAYDTLGRVTSRTDTKGLDSFVTAYHYDDLLGSDADPDTSCMINENDFDPDEDSLNGRLAWVSVGNLVRYFSYDDFGATTAVYEQTGSTFDVCNLNITRYSYDDQGRTLSTTYPSGLRYRVDYGFSDKPEYGHVYFPTYGEYQIANLWHNFSGQLGQVVFPGWSYITMNAYHDFSGQWTRRVYNQSSNILFDWAADYDNDGSVESSERDGNGNILSVLDRVSGDGFVATMNAFDELADFRRPGASTPECEYTYDGGGNRLSLECGSEVVSYSYETGTSRLEETEWTGLPAGCSGTAPLSVMSDVDAVGGVVQYAKNGCPSDVHTIDYDATGSVSGFDSNSATAVTYDERHLARTMGNRKLTYDLQGHLINERIGDVDNQYFWDGDQLIFFITTLPGWFNIGHAVGTDHLGAPWRAWAGTSTSWSVSYEPFGKVTPENGATSFSPTPAIAVRRPGQIADSASGVLQNSWRFYNPTSGSYVQPDPARIGADPAISDGSLALGAMHSRVMNPRHEQAYSYGLNAPLGNIDPDGRFAFALPLACAGGGCQALATAALAGATALAVGATIAIAELCSEPPSGCPPCPPPPPSAPEPPRVDTTHTHYPCDGGHIHLYSWEVNQNPTTCECFNKKVETIICL